MNKSDLRARLIEDWQRDFPLTQKPFVKIAHAAGVDESAVLESLAEMQAEGVLSRVGAVVRPNTVGASTLAAMKVPVGELDEVAELVNAEPGVNHNYEREHEFNLWFVATARNNSTLDETLQRISARTGHEAVSLPLHRAHHIDLGFSVCPALNGTTTQRDRRAGMKPPPTLVICEQDRQLLAAIEDGLPLVSRPYDEVARQVGTSESDVIGRLDRLVEGRVVSRFGLVVRHRLMGYTNNAMAVWDIRDDEVDAMGDLLAARPFVTLCYQRRRARPHWPYNLFCMIHGNERAQVLTQIDELNVLLEGRSLQHTVLFSKKCFKQRGARFSSPRKTTMRQAAAKPAEMFHVG